MVAPRRALSLLLAALVLSGAACRRDKASGDGTDPLGLETSLPPLTIRDDTPGLLLTWIDDRGDAHTEIAPPSVPEAGRKMVRVVVSDRQAGTGELFYVVDLTKKSGDGYEARTVKRAEWEAFLDERRNAFLAKVTPPPRPTIDAEGKLQGGSAAVTVIVYGASWCKPCHQAEDYLRQKGVRVLMKDVERSEAADREMREKLSKAGIRGGSIPIIDVRGRILVGFSPRELDRALSAAQSGTTL
jgi:glutaredoxin